ncbi:hypothetical protein FISHEDRAFT_57916 [Fistulina hepatica ATCC 64428]|uniref:Uncharacterized protein n=1 Tax=Fistulina hepatica ATCC 64428 TaxID=1128425 RepID=A0A0D7AFM8_9AGAR|nr:hypothetical protein FISHEDRAFT_57916 [Fistulina hepatica ATCC 64428]
MVFRRTSSSGTLESDRTDSSSNTKPSSKSSSGSGTRDPGVLHITTDPASMDNTPSTRSSSDAATSNSHESAAPLTSESLALLDAHHERATLASGAVPGTLPEADYEEVPTEIATEPDDDPLYRAELAAYGLKVRDFAFLQPATTYAPTVRSLTLGMKPAFAVWNPAKALAEYDIRVSRRIRTWPVPPQDIKRLLFMGWLSPLELHQRLHEIDWCAIEWYENICRTRVVNADTIGREKGLYAYVAALGDYTESGEFPFVVPLDFRVFPRPSYVNYRLLPPRSHFKPPPPMSMRRMAESEEHVSLNAAHKMLRKEVNDHLYPLDEKPRTIPPTMDSDEDLMNIAWFALKVWREQLQESTDRLNEVFKVAEVPTRRATPSPEYSAPPGDAATVAGTSVENGVLTAQTRLLGCTTAAMPQTVAHAMPPPPVPASAAPPAFIPPLSTTVTPVRRPGKAPAAPDTTVPQSIPSGPTDMTPMLEPGEVSRGRKRLARGEPSTAPLRKRLRLPSASDTVAGSSGASASSSTCADTTASMDLPHVAGAVSSPATIASNSPAQNSQPTTARVRNRRRLAAEATKYF